jgi:hypothetical protein
MCLVALLYSSRQQYWCLNQIVAAALIRLDPPSTTNHYKLREQQQTPVIAIANFVSSLYDRYQNFTLPFNVTHSKVNDTYKPHGIRVRCNFYVHKFQDL